MKIKIMISDGPTMFRVVDMYMSTELAALAPSTRTIVLSVCFMFPALAPSIMKYDVDIREGP